MNFEFPVRVYIEDTDMGGVVYYANYLKFLERARTELVRALGYSQHELQVQGFLFVVHRVECDYLQPARLDDELIVRVNVTKQTATALQFSQYVTRVGADQVLCRAQVKVVCVDAATMRPTRIPVALKKDLERYRESACTQAHVLSGKEEPVSG
jgi:tol-pal system-associated acyl-CoA thioesterase